jgi:elongation factor G
MTSKQGLTRCAVLVGPQGGGKTTLTRAIIERTGAKAPVFDYSAEAKSFAMTTEPNFARCNYLGDIWNFVDCPGSNELIQASEDAMRAADIVVIVAEPNPERIASLGSYFKFLDDHDIPHVLFVNHLDEVQVRVRDLLQSLQAYSERPLVLRQAPIRDGDTIVGAVDLVSERAWRYREGKQSELIEIPASVRDREAEARETMLDTVADFDDALMEQILEDKVPASDEIYDLMAQELREDIVVPVLLGSAAHGHGVTRLLKLLRHEAPEVAVAAARLGFDKGGKTVASVMRTMHVPHTGKLSVMRVWKGALKNGDALGGGRITGLLALNGATRDKLAEAHAGDLACAPRTDELATGDVVIDGQIHKQDFAGSGRAPVYALAIRAKNARDDVKLSSALAKLREEDASILAERRPDTGELLLRGQGDVHLRLVAAKLKNQYNIEIETSPPTPAYRETIRGGGDHHTRHKKQSGGHGQFADIKIKLKPLPRGAGFAFDDTIHGGTVPKQFIPAVEAGVKGGLARGPLGFPVVDLAVTLCDGQHHAVDSNEMSFKLAGQQAMREALPNCDPVLLEPIYETRIHTPSDCTNKAHGVISSRRGQILGFDARDGWPGWDTVTAMMPETGLQGLIIELRSLSQGAATYEASFDHYQELFGNDADKVVAERKAEAG